MSHFEMVAEFDFGGASPADIVAFLHGSVD
jgi:hypothetical protein